VADSEKVPERGMPALADAATHLPTTCAQQHTQRTVHDAKPAATVSCSACAA
jgi:hypothetical protein